ncbi:transposase [Streptomyces sp. NPDC059568]|uniref:transposase n=1 Tax=Streptomyces sp. NPDC059568 TaxID=3346868 RepID=UPI0036B78D01
MALVRADGGYTGWLVAFAHAVLALTLTAVKRSDDTKGFVVLVRRWVVERSFSWLIRARRLARDYETRIDSAEAMAWWAASIQATRRLARSGPPRPAGSSGPRPEQPRPPLGQPAPLHQPLRPEPRRLLPSCRWPASPDTRASPAPAPPRRHRRPRHVRPGPRSARNPPGAHRPPSPRATAALQPAIRRRPRPAPLPPASRTQRPHRLPRPGPRRSPRGR